MRAFVLGAGLGTRLRALTEWLPKPLVPLFGRPLITCAFDHLLDLRVETCIINTHHCPEAYRSAFPDGVYRGCPLLFRHEPVLLETAGGIANIADFMEGEERFLVYNGDILTDAPLEPLLAGHLRAGNEVTLMLRRDGPSRHIGLDPVAGRVRDIRGMLGEPAGLSCQFTGIYVVESPFLDRLTPGKKESVIPVFLDMIRNGAALGGCVVDEGNWWDLGDVETYLAVHRDLPETGFPLYDPVRRWERISPGARIDPGADVDAVSCVGEGAVVGKGAVIRKSILWPGAVVAAGTTIDGEVVRGSPP